MSGQRQRIAILPGKDGSGNRTSSAGAATYKESCDLIDLSSYKEIQMSDDEDVVNSSLVICQAKVTMEELVRYTMRSKNMIPKVVAEFRNITVGGAISGAALESTSHKYGQFMDTVAWIKVLTGSGEIVTTNKGDSLWCSLSGTYGSMGIVLEAALECVPATPYVQVSYYAFDSVEHGIKALLDVVSEKRHVFLDGLTFPPQQVPLQSVEDQNPANRRGTVVMQGEMIGSFEDPPRIQGWKCKVHGGSFYYEHVRDLLNEHFRKARKRNNLKSDRTTVEAFFQEVIYMEDYLFRYDYGAFWMARPMAFEPNKLLSYFPFIICLFIASYRWVRIVTGSMFTTKTMFKILKQAPESVVAKRMVVQDCYIPPETVNGFLSWVYRSIPISTPIWLCPVLFNNNQPFTPSYKKQNQSKPTVSAPVMINCGIYGRVSDGRGAYYTQQLEAMCEQLGGRKMLYAQNHYTESDFWRIFDQTIYDVLRESHHATEAFPSLYEKTCGVAEWKNTWVEAIMSLFL
ncbi:FAD binding protein [Nitzschia inconspicua]|uniref:Delta(24)-sterol reductase n=1 Tax=Nitzschia inconspicua TaxID=303405 RepID=A0A9K3PY48_9STRA|nr:FAD binding protein [Nitzschia inconspicua]